MKKTNYIKFLNYILVIWVVFFGTFLFPVSSDSDLAAGTSFTFYINSPVNNANLNSGTVLFSGAYSLDTTTYPNSSLTVLIQDTTDPNNPVTIPSDGILINPDNTWSFTHDFTEGAHTVKFTANDGYNSSISRTVSFTIDTQRPVVSNYKIVAANHVGNPKTWEDSIIEDMTHVPLDGKIQITVRDLNSLTYKKNSDGTWTNPIKVISDSQINIASVEDGQVPPQPNANGDYTITFTPSSQLEPSTTYFVNITTNIVDSSGNSVYPKTIKFTTTSQKDQSINDDDPHGDYDISDPTTGMNRTNLCANCHNTHMGGNVKLLGGKYIKDTTKNPTEQDNTTNYCMACHDGTSASRLASKVDNMDLSTGSKHDELLDSKHLPNEGSCSSCHDPHLVWSKENPNMLQDHFTYEHNSADISKNAPSGIIDSDNVLCETCHDRLTYTVKGETGVEYKISHYRKSTNRLGTLEDNDLCFRCHNANKLQNSDIQTLTEDSNSKHNFAALDGSNVTGPMTCSECHETHGSSNIKLLKQKLGQENLQGDFVATSGDWDAAKEKEFCLKCHNGSTTVYGVTGKAISANHDVDPVTQETKACSTCHGGTSKSFLEAAHSPKSATP